MDAFGWGTIALCALVTVSIRLSGFAIGDRPVSPRMHAFLEAVPLTAFSAIAAMGIVTGGPTETGMRVAAAAATGLVTLRIGKLWAALLAGMAVYTLLRLAGIG